MSSEVKASELLATINPISGTVLMMCGMAGSGKTTFAKQVEAKGFTRLSIDEEIWQRFGKYGVDYEPTNYPRHQDAARASLYRQVVDLLSVKQPTILDFSFWSRASRDEYKQLIVQHECMWMLIYMRATPAQLRDRLAVRSQRFDANAAFPIADDLLTQYVAAFEEPKDEGEIVVIPSQEI